MITWAPNELPSAEEIAYINAILASPELSDDEIESEIEEQRLFDLTMDYHTEQEDALKEELQERRERGE